MEVACLVLDAFLLSDFATALLVDTGFSDLPAFLDDWGGGAGLPELDFGFVVVFSVEAGLLEEIEALMEECFDETEALMEECFDETEALTEECFDETEAFLEDTF